MLIHCLMGFHNSYYRCLWELMKNIAERIRYSLCQTWMTTTRSWSIFFTKTFSSFSLIDFTGTFKLTQYLSLKKDESEPFRNSINYLVNSFDSLILQFRSRSSPCAHIKTFDLSNTFSICNNKSMAICVWSWIFSTVHSGELLNRRSMIIWYIDTYLSNIFFKDRTVEKLLLLVMYRHF